MNYPNVQLFIDGKWRPSASGKTIDDSRLEYIPFRLFMGPVGKNNFIIFIYANRPAIYYADSRRRRQKGGELPLNFFGMPDIVAVAGRDKITPGLTRCMIARTLPRTVSRDSCGSSALSGSAMESPTGMRGSRLASGS